MITNARLVTLALAAAPTALACLGWEGGLPVATGNVQLREPIYVRAGEVYDGGWQKFDRNPSTCSDQQEGGESDTAFVVESGGVCIGLTSR